MRYILDDLGYIEVVSSYLMACNNKSCTEYTGTIPEGYETLEEWAINSNIRAYKIVDGNLTYDADRDSELQEEWEKGGAIFVGKLLGGKSIALENVKRFLEIYFVVSLTNDRISSKYTIDTSLEEPTYGGTIFPCSDDSSKLTYYLSDCKFQASSKILTHLRSGYVNVETGKYNDRNDTSSYYIYRIETHD